MSLNVTITPDMHKSEAEYRSAENIFVVLIFLLLIKLRRLPITQFLFFLKG